MYHICEIDKFIFCDILVEKQLDKFAMNISFIFIPVIYFIHLIQRGM